MREKRITVIISLPIAVSSLISACFFNYCNKFYEPFVVNVSLAIFGSALLTGVAAYVGYYSERRRFLKEYGDILMTMANTLCRYKYNSSKAHDLYKNAKILADLHSLTNYSLSPKYFEFSPFFRKSEYNQFIYSAYSYFHEFLDKINKDLKVIESMNNDGILNDVIAKEAFSNIERYIFTKNETRVNGSTSIEIENSMLHDFEKYLREYTVVINNKHKGKYISLDTGSFD